MNRFVSLYYGAFHHPKRAPASRSGQGGIRGEVSRAPGLSLALLPLQHVQGEGGMWISCLAGNFVEPREPARLVLHV